MSTTNKPKITTRRSKVYKKKYVWQVWLKGQKVGWYYSYNDAIKLAERIVRNSAKVKTTAAAGPKFT